MRAWARGWRQRVSFLNRVLYVRPLQRSEPPTGRDSESATHDQVASRHSYVSFLCWGFHRGQILISLRAFCFFSISTAVDRASISFIAKKTSGLLSFRFFRVKYGLLFARRHTGFDFYRGGQHTLYYHSFVTPRKNPRAPWGACVGGSLPSRSVFRGLCMSPLFCVFVHILFVGLNPCVRTHLHGISAAQTSLTLCHGRVSVSFDLD